MSQPALTPRAWIDLCLLALAWGAIFLVVEFALRGLTPLWAVFHRVFWAALVLWALVHIRGGRMPGGLRVWFAFFVMGALNNAIPFSLITWGQVEIESGLAAILNATTAFFGVTVAAIFLADERLTAAKLAGAAIGVAGVALVMGPEAASGFDPRALGQLAVLGAALSYAFAGVWAKKRLAGLSPVISATGMLTGSSVIMALTAFAAEGPPTLSLTAGTIAAIAYMSLVGTVIAYLLYYRILAAAGAGNLLLVTVIIPPLAVFLGWAVLGERPSPNAFAGAALILFGLAILDGRLWRVVRSRIGI